MKELKRFLTTFVPTILLGAASQSVGMLGEFLLCMTAFLVVFVFVTVFLNNERG